MIHFTAHDKSAFNELLDELPDLVHELKSKDKASDALFIYLMRLRTARTYQEIAIHFGVSISTVERRCDLVRSILKRVVVPRYVNVELNREELVRRKSATSKILFDGETSDRAHIILDGTYIYLEKSTNHRFQKDTFNSHKKRNYIKIMMGVLTNGEILFTLGPFKATENDAAITEKIFTADTPCTRAFMPEDIIILDRGFRDCITDLMNRGFIVKMPTCSLKSQLTTREANDSRFVTKVRYNVERMNGVMKNVWKIFSEVVDIRYVTKIMSDFEIGAALLNRKSKVTEDSDEAVALARQMIHRQNRSNDISKIIDSKAFEKIMKENKYEQFNDFESCPQLTMSDLQMISLGLYQIEQSKCYISNHIHERDSDLDIHRFFPSDYADLIMDIINPDTDHLLLTMRLKSRFVSNRVYRVYLLFDKNEIGFRSVLQYCCSCKVGNRTVGCCSHVMTLLYFVCYARGHGIKEISKHLKNVFENNNWHNEIEEYEVVEEFEEFDDENDDTNDENIEL